MIGRLLFVAAVVAYLVVVIPFTGYLNSRPVEVKLGYIPHPQILKIASGSHASTVAQMAVTRVLFYFGTIIQKFEENVIIRPEFYNMYKTLQTASQLDPYNMDVYYFAQAAFTWELGKVEEVNFLLKRGAEYRTWDYWLPFYIGFNYAYFLQDYPQAAEYMQKAAEISGNPLLTKLAARYFYESEQTAFGLAFLETMIKQAKEPAVKRTYELRYEALKASQEIEKATTQYFETYGYYPDKLENLVVAGLIEKLPDDPYGGSFYLDEQGKVRSTSKFADPNR